MKDKTLTEIKLVREENPICVTDLNMIDHMQQKDVQF